MKEITTNNELLKSIVKVFKRDLHPVEFWDGYRAFIYGGERHKVKGRACIVSFREGLEPPDTWSDKQKDYWYEGMAYAKQEREEIRKEFPKPRRDFYPEQTEKLKEMGFIKK